MYLSICYVYFEVLNYFNRAANACIICCAYMTACLLTVIFTFLFQML